MREERGEPPLTEDELPNEQEDAAYGWWQYYEHALQDLSRHHDNGKIPDCGTVFWY